MTAHRTRMVSESTAALTPSQILSSALVAHYKADSGTSTTVEDAAISQWDDQSGNGNHLVQATGSKQPIYKGAVRNGLAVVRFDGSDDLMADAFTLNQPCEIAAVLRYRSAPGATRTYASGSGSSTGAAWFNSSGIWNTFAGSTLNFTNTVPAPTATDWNMLLVLLNGSSSFMSYNGGLRTLTGAAGASNPGGLTVGASGASGGSQWADVDVGEIVVSNAALSTLQRSQLHGYLAGRWALP